MKTLQEFQTFVHLKKHFWKLSLVLIIASLFYCVAYSFVQTIVYMGNPIAYYIALYFLVIWSAYIFMIIIFSFVQKKRDEQSKLKLKSYIMPLLMVQSMLYFIMIAVSLVTLYVSTTPNPLFYIGSALCILLSMFYIPLQLLSFFQIYDGKRNPFIILYNACKMIVVHYRSIFYAMFTLFMLALFYDIVMDMFFSISATSTPYMMAQDIMVNSNPFMNVINYIMFAFENGELWDIIIITFIYGISMCCLLTYFYMFMICVHDNDIKL